MNSSVHITLKGISKRYGSMTAVDSASLDIPLGQTFALLGPSGCGKTTLLRMIAGLETPDAGTITKSETILNNPDRLVPPEARNVGMVFQNSALFPHMTVGKNVAYGLGRKPDPERIERALEMVDLAGFANRDCSTLSGGQAQRVALARALAPEPEVLLLDEPLAALDAGLRARIRSDVAGLLGELNITAVFVTHDQEEAFVVGDHVAVMKEGRLLQSGSPEEIYDNPVNPWVAQFVGDANLLYGIAEGTVAETEIGRIPLTCPTAGPCDVVVRPEYIAVEQGNVARVEGVEFYGHDTVYFLAVNGNGHKITVRVLAAPRFGVGDHVQLAYDGPSTMAFQGRSATRL